MSEWKTIKNIEIDLLGNNFITISLKQTPKEENFLIAISKGWYTKDKKKRYKSNILFDKNKKDEIIKALQDIDKN